jgi:hypothetical protein
MKISHLFCCFSTTPQSKPVYPPHYGTAQSTPPQRVDEIAQAAFAEADARAKLLDTPAKDIQVDSPPKDIQEAYSPSTLPSDNLSESSPSLSGEIFAVEEMERHQESPNTSSNEELEGQPLNRDASPPPTIQLRLTVEHIIHGLHRSHPDLQRQYQLYEKCLRRLPSSPKIRHLSDELRPPLLNE